MINGSIKYTKNQNYNLPTKVLIVPLRVGRPSNPECAARSDDPKHIMFNCPKFVEERRKLNSVLKGKIRITISLRSEANWIAVITSIVAILKKIPGTGWNAESATNVCYDRANIDLARREELILISYHTG